MFMRRFSLLSMLALAGLLSSPVLASEHDSHQVAASEPCPDDGCCDDDCDEGSCPSCCYDGGGCQDDGDGCGDGCDGGCEEKAHDADNNQ